MRPLLFLASADLAHSFGLWAFRRKTIWSLLRRFYEVRDERLEIDIFDKRLRNPIGLAAGFDKDAELLHSMSALGFGFLTIGSVRPRPHPGNPKPWLVRYPEENALVNSLGLPSKGAAHVLSNLAQAHLEVPIFCSIAGESVDDFIAVLEKLQGHVDGIEVNVSCPNVERDGTFEDDLAMLDILVSAITERKKRPILLKLSPFPARERDKMLQIVDIAKRRGVDGITAVNATPIPEDRLGVGRGGLTGSSVRGEARRVVSDIYEEVQGKIPIIGVGGVSSGKDAYDMIAHGATAVALLTALIYSGPDTAQIVNKELLEMLTRKHFSSIKELVGYHSRTPS